MHKQRTKPTRGLGPSNWSICSCERRLYFVFSILVLKRNKTKKQQIELLDVSERNKQTSKVQIKPTEGKVLSNLTNTKD